MPLMSQRAFAQHRGVNPSYVSRLISRGLLRRHDGGKLDSAECDQIIDAAHVVSPEGGISLVEAQTRKALAEAALKEIQLQIKRREMAPVSDMIAIMEREYLAVRAVLLSLPTKVCGRIPQGQRKLVIQLLTACVRDALTNLAGRPASASEQK